MKVFVSYSSRDREAVKSLVQDLQDADEQVWMDQRLAVGEAWWRAILEQIRSCEVFIFALSQNSIDSKPCLAELQYAQTLGLAVLPVQVGSVDSMSLTPLAMAQAIDYRHQTPNTGMRLIAALHRERARRQPLPEPLPDEPPVPFEYLIRLFTTISNPDYLTPRDQAALVAQLQVGLGEDGKQDGARNNIVLLLTKLHDREDATYRTRTDVEAILSSVGVKLAPQSSDADAAEEGRRASRGLTEPVNDVAISTATPPQSGSATEPDRTSTPVKRNGEIDTEQSTSLRDRTQAEAKSAPDQASRGQENSRAAVAAPFLSTNAPPQVRNPISTATATLHTNRGDIKIALFGNHAPKTVANFVGLAQGTKEYATNNAAGGTSGPFYDGAVFHRVIDGFMIQSGDPTGTGGGSPGYQFSDEFHPELQFDRPYLLAMANAGPGTNGSQFFITVRRTPHLNRRHTIFGEVVDTESQKVVDAIATTATDRYDRPIEPVVIESITVSHEGVPDSS